MANVIAKLNRPHAGAGAQQNAGCPALYRVQGVFSGQRGGVFRELLRLLPAGGVYAAAPTPILRRTASINEEIDRLRHSATAALSERRDVIIVASVSCIYSLGDPIDYRSMVISLRPGMQMNRDELLRTSGGPAVRAQRRQLYPQQVPRAGRHGGDHTSPICQRRWPSAWNFLATRSTASAKSNALTGERQRGDLKHVAIFPASHYIVPTDKMRARPLQHIQDELDEQDRVLQRQGQAAGGPAHRPAHQCTTLRCCGKWAPARASRTTPAILSGRAPGSAPYTLLDYFPEDFLLFVDESPCDRCPRCAPCTAATTPAKKAWWTSASACRRHYDNRPLKFEEF